MFSIGLVVTNVIYGGFCGKIRFSANTDESTSGSVIGSMIGINMLLDRFLVPRLASPTEHVELVPLETQPVNMTDHMTRSLCRGW